MDCPCGRGRYADCCGPLHAGMPAADAEALMRSRYSAYALGFVLFMVTLALNFIALRVVKRFREAYE